MVVRTWFRTLGLDRQLAGGRDPESNPALSRRAQALIQAHVREQLARSVRRVAREAGRPAAQCGVPVPLAREEVEGASDELRLLASRLTAPVPVAPRGVAQVRILLSDGTGPLYRRGRPGELGAAAREAITRLAAG